MTAESHANLKRVRHLGSGGGGGSGDGSSSGGSGWRAELEGGQGFCRRGSKLKLTWTRILAPAAAAPHSCGHSPHRSATREAEIHQINAYAGCLIPQLASIILANTIISIGNMNQVDRTVSEKVIKLFYDFKLVIINSVLFQRSKWDHLKNCSRFKPHLNIDLDNQSIRHIHFQSHSV